MHLKKLIFGAVAAILLVAGGANAQIQKTVTLLKGEVVSEGQKVAGCQVSIYKGTEKVFTTKSNSEGKFTATLPPNTTYRVAFTSGKHLFHEEMLVVPAMEKFAETKLHASLRPLRSGETFPLTAMVFAPKSSLIEGAAATQLEEIAKIAKSNPKLSLIIKVYPDATTKAGKDAAQQKLVASRASAVMSFLLSKGIQQKSFEIEQNSSAPPSGGKFSVEVTETKKKKKITKTVLVPQYIEVTTKIG